MALSDLPAAGVFWNDRRIEPKRQYRFKLVLNNIEEWMVKSVARPGFTVAETPHKYLNYTFYYPGSVEWSDVSFTLVDPVQPDATGLMMAMLVGAGYRMPTQKDGVRTISKEEAVNALGSMKIQMFHTGDPEKQMDNQLGGGVEIIEEWTLQNPWISAATFGELAYDGDELTNIEVTVKYDWATWNPGTRGFERALSGLKMPEIVAGADKLIAGGD